MLGAFVVESKKVVCGWFHICKNTSISAGMKKNEHPFFPPSMTHHQKVLRSCTTQLSLSLRRLRFVQFKIATTRRIPRNTQNLGYVAPSSPPERRQREERGASTQCSKNWSPKANSWKASRLRYCHLIQPSELQFAKQDDIHRNVCSLVSRHPDPNIKHEHFPDAWCGEIWIG